VLIVDNFAKRPKAGCVDGDVYRETYEGFDISEADNKDETGKYKRNFSLSERIIKLHCILGGAKNNESMSSFWVISLIIVNFLYIPENKPIKMNIQGYSK